MLNECPIPQKLLDIIARELEPGERTEWVGMPVPRYFTPMSTATFVFGIPWTAFAIFWTVSAGEITGVSESFGIFNLFALFGLPFILIGFGMLSSPLWAYRKALKTVYVITDRRAITIDGGVSTTIRSYPPDQLQNIYRKEKSDGTGDIVISRRAWRDSDGDSRSEELGFLRIRDPRTVEGLLKKLAGTVGEAEK
jgi:hypothetical protein